MNDELENDELELKMLDMEDDDEVDYWSVNPNDVREDINRIIVGYQTYRERCVGLEKELEMRIDALDAVGISSCDNGTNTVIITNRELATKWFNAEVEQAD